MIYTFACSECGEHIQIEASIKSGPPEPFCHGDGCDGVYARVWNTPQLLIRGDPDEVAPQNRLVDTSHMSTAQAANWGGMSESGALRKERAYHRHIQRKRAQLAGQKQQGGRLTHSVPAELYHAKIKETGDKNYWSDPANLNRHKSCKVS